MKKLDAIFMSIPTVKHYLATVCIDIPRMVIFFTFAWHHVCVIQWRKKQEKVRGAQV